MKKLCLMASQSILISQTQILIYKKMVYDAFTQLHFATKTLFTCCNKRVHVKEFTRQSDFS